MEQEKGENLLSWTKPIHYFMPKNEEIDDFRKKIDSENHINNLISFTNSTNLYNEVENNRQKLYEKIQNNLINMVMEKELERINAVFFNGEKISPPIDINDDEMENYKNDIHSELIKYVYNHTESEDNKIYQVFQLVSENGGIEKVDVLKIINSYFQTEIKNNASVKIKIKGTDREFSDLDSLEEFLNDKKNYKELYKIVMSELTEQKKKLKSSEKQREFQKKSIDSIKKLFINDELKEDIEIQLAQDLGSGLTQLIKNDYKNGYSPSISFVETTVRQKNGKIRNIREYHTVDIPIEINSQGFEKLSENIREGIAIEIIYRAYQDKEKKIKNKEGGEIIFTDDIEKKVKVKEILKAILDEGSETIDSAISSIKSWTNNSNLKGEFFEKIITNCLNKIQLKAYQLGNKKLDLGIGKKFEANSDIIITNERIISGIKNDLEKTLTMVGMQLKEGSSFSPDSLYASDEKKGNITSLYRFLDTEEWEAFADIYQLEKLITDIKRNSSFRFLKNYLTQKMELGQLRITLNKQAEKEVGELINPDLKEYIYDNFNSLYLISGFLYPSSYILYQRFKRMNKSGRGKISPYKIYFDKPDQITYEEYGQATNIKNLVQVNNILKNAKFNRSSR